MAQETALPDFLEGLRWRWKPILATALLTLVAVTFVARSLPSQYDAKTVLSIAPRPDVPAAGADTVRVIAPKYVAYVTAPATISAVAPSVGERPSVAEKAVDAALKTDTGNLTITVRLRSPKRAAALANALADRVVGFSKLDPLLTAEVVARALPPKSPAAPRRRLLEAIGLVVGVLWGIAISLILERGRPRLRSWRHIGELTGYPLLGRIPRSRALRSRQKEAFSDPAVGAAFRTLRANLEPRLREDDADVVAVTSPSVGDGKTTVAALLAESLSRLDIKVLLLDADLRHPQIARLAGVSADHGLSNILRGAASPKGAVQPGWCNGLWILPTSEDPDAGDLIARGFSSVLEQLRPHFDIIVVDTPPLLGTDDSRALAQTVKALALVVTAGADARLVNEAVLALEAVKAPLIGVIANRFPESSAVYQYY